MAGGAVPAGAGDRGVGADRDRGVAVHGAGAGGDVAIERQDQVFLAEDGTPWIRSDPAPDVADDDVRWHRGARKVYDRLEKAGMFGPAERPGESGAGLRARWALWGALAGVALGGGGAWGLRRWSARRDAEPVAREPRQELIDL